MSLLEEFIKEGLINENQITEVKNRAQEKYGGDLEIALEEFGVDKYKILEIKGKYFNIPIRKVDKKDISYSLLKYIPVDSAKHYGFVPVNLNNGVLEIGITEPENIQSVDVLQFISTKLNMPFKIFLIDKEDYKKIISAYDGVSLETEEILDDLNNEEGKIDINKNALNDLNLNEEIKKIKEKKEEKLVEEAPIIKIVSVILKNALDGNASDIHVEHTGEKVKIRYRVDGSLFTSLLLPPNVHSGLVARIKILAKLHLDEKRKPQDGSFSTNIDNRKIDFRVSTMPGYYGEKVVLRILDAQRGVKKLEELGLSETNLNLIKEAIKKPYGLILITGPTGSGKTTTLYSIMNELDKEKNNIVSLEDPIEYHMPDVNQSQVLPEIGYSFATGIRSILRQDPNIIMVGEIRDKETAQLAIQASLTGHLVLSTLHTNNAIGAIPRLVDMGIPPYLIAPTLKLSIAQRLGHLTCPSSRKINKISPSIKIQIDKQFQDLPIEYKEKLNIKEEMYETVPSAECPFGTRGRIAIFEVLKIDKELERVILENPTYNPIYKIARARGMLTMKEDAILKGINGIIPFEDIYSFSDEGE